MDTMSKYKNSIIYCTNNLLPPLLFDKTLNDAHDHAERSSSELIVASHFPVLKSFIKINDDINLTIDNKINVLNKIVSLSFDFNNSRNYVFGKLPYSLETILEQLLYAIKLAESDKIIIMEHDCLYPDNYVDVMSDCLDKEDIAYISKAKVFLNFNGFFNTIEQLTMSNIAWKKDLAIKVIERKLRLAKENGTFEAFEPIIYRKEDMERKPLLRAMLEQIKNDPNRDIPILDFVCADDIFIKVNKVALDIKHGLNQSGYIKVNEDKYFEFHEYWGNSYDYTSLFSLENCDNLKYWYGVKVF